MTFIPCNRHTCLLPPSFVGIKKKWISFTCILIKCFQNTIHCIHSTTGPFYELPIDVVVNLFQWLDITSIDQLSGTHTTFKNAANSKEIWTTLNIYRKSVNLDVLLKYIDKFKGHITTIVFNGLESIQHSNEEEYEPHVSDIINHCYALITIVIDSGSIIDGNFRIYDELSKRLRIIKLRNIKHIVPNTLANRKLFTRKYFVQRMSQFSNLRHLEISGTSTLICGNIFCIMQSMSMLTHLNVEGTCYIRPNHVIKIMEIRPKLETLIFTHHEFQDDIVQSKKSSREWYHLTRMYYPWVKFSQGLACLVKDYMSSRRN